MAELEPTDEDIAWVEAFLDNLSPEILEIVRRPTERQKARMEREL